VTSNDKLDVTIDPIGTARTSLKMFRSLEDHDIIMGGGAIRGRLEEDHDGIPIYDELRECLFLEDSEKFAAFSTQDRKEFLFRVFKHLVVGGAANQYEDSVEPYLAATGSLYKDLVSVRKNDSGDLKVLSTVWEVLGLGDGGQLFTRSHLSNFCYLCFDPQTRHVTLFYFQHRPIW
jgi:hypothetical protein